MKKQKIVGIVAVLLLLIVLAGTAQEEVNASAPKEEWIRTFGGGLIDRGYSVQQTSDGGYIIGGWTCSYGSGKEADANVWLIKTNSKGNEKWSKTFGGSNDDTCYSIQRTSDGGYIIVGETESYGAGSSDVWLIKTNSKGNEEWNKTFGGAGKDIGYSIQQTSDGGYIITGKTWSYGGGWGDVWLIKTDSKGIEEWCKTFGGSDVDYGCSVQQTFNGGYIIVGETESYGAGSSDVWLIKTNSEGNEEWSKTFGRSDEDTGRSVQQTSDGGYIIVGETESYGAGSSDVWLIKTDSKGNEEWSKTFGRSDEDIGRSVQQTSDEGYVIVGETESYGAGSSDVWLIKTDSKGIKEWSKTFGKTYKDHGRSVQQTSDGGYVIIGDTCSYSGGYLAAGDVYLIKVMSEGEEKGIPGFEAIFSIICLLAVAYILRGRNK